MAIAATCVFEIRPTTGAANNGGGFNSLAAGTDRSQQVAAQVVIDNVAITCTTPGAGSNTLTFTAGYVASAADVGNLVAITGGLNINANIYEITGFTNGPETWTVTGPGNLTTGGGAGSAILGNMGGARSGFSNGTTPVQGILVAGNRVWVKNEAWNEAVSFTIAAGVNTPNVIEGYNTVRGDAPTGANRPENDRALAAGVGITITAARYILKHLRVARAGTQGFSHTNNVGIIVNCRARNCGSNGFNLTGATIGPAVIGCEANNNNIGFSVFGLQTLFGCVAHDNTTDGFLGGAAGLQFVHCISYANGSVGFRTNTNTYRLIHCVADGNTGDGINSPNPDGGAAIYNCILSNNTGFGLNVGAGNGNLIADFNDFFNNTAGARNNATAGANDQTLDPQFTDRANGNFAQGANLWALGWPGAFPVTDVAATAGFATIGAATPTPVAPSPPVTNVSMAPGAPWKW